MGANVMDNLIRFVNSFLEYLLLFGISSLVIVGGVFAGIKYRKSKDLKTVVQTEEV